MSPIKVAVSGTSSYLRMIKFSHSIFALPFAFSAVVLAWPRVNITWEMILWIVIAMVSARSAAMGFNRYADAAIDAENPRTAIREIPAGKISKNQALLFIIISSGVLMAASYMLSIVCFYFSVPLLILLFFYSYTKRFTWFAHIYLGLVIGLAPIAVWVALVGMPELSVILLGLVSMTHIAGFDILYACQDADFDTESGLHSIPSRFGVGRAMMLSALIHILTVSFLAALYFAAGFGIAYAGIVLVIAVLLFIEHRLVHPDDLSNINIAFFHINSVISVLVLGAVLTGYLTGR